MDRQYYKNWTDMALKAELRKRGLKIGSNHIERENQLYQNDLEIDNNIERALIATFAEQPKVRKFPPLNSYPNFKCR